jgi:hypothetical protein
MSDVYGYSSELSMGNSVNDSITALNRNIRAQNVLSREKYQNRIKGLQQTYTNANPTLDKVKEGAEGTTDALYALGGAVKATYRASQRKGALGMGGSAATTEPEELAFRPDTPLPAPRGGGGVAGSTERIASGLSSAAETPSRNILETGGELTDFGRGAGGALRGGRGALPPISPAAFAGDGYQIGGDLSFGQEAGALSNHIAPTINSIARYTDMSPEQVRQAGATVQRFDAPVQGKTVKIADEPEIRSIPGRTSGGQTLTEMREADEASKATREIAPPVAEESAVKNGIGVLDKGGAVASGLSKVSGALTAVNVLQGGYDAADDLLKGRIAGKNIQEKRANVAGIVSGGLDAAAVGIRKVGTKAASSGAEALGEAAGLEEAGAAADATGIGAIVGLGLGVAGAATGLYGAFESYEGDKAEKAKAKANLQQAKAQGPPQQPQQAQQDIGSTGAQITQTSGGLGAVS